MQIAKLATPWRGSISTKNLPKNNANFVLLIAHFALNQFYLPYPSHGRRSRTALALTFFA